LASINAQSKLSTFLQAVADMLCQITSGDDWIVKSILAGCNKARHRAILIGDLVFDWAEDVGYGCTILRLHLQKGPHDWRGPCGCHKNECKSHYKSSVNGKRMERPANWTLVSAARGKWARKSLLKALHERCLASCYPERRKYSRAGLVNNVGNHQLEPSPNTVGNPWVALAIATPSRKPVTPTTAFCEANARIWSLVRKGPAPQDIVPKTASYSSWENKLDDRSGLLPPQGPGTSPSPPLPPRGGGVSLPRLLLPKEGAPSPQGLGASPVPRLSLQRGGPGGEQGGSSSSSAPPAKVSRPDPKLTYS
jgi:hypothetical protein